jgi:hypothetical protein
VLPSLELHDRRRNRRKRRPLAVSEVLHRSASADIARVPCVDRLVAKDFATVEDGVMANRMKLLEILFDSDSLDLADEVTMATAWR